MTTPVTPPVGAAPLVATSLAMNLAGGILGGADAKRQARRRAAAIRRAQARISAIADQEAGEQYKAGGIRQSALLAHLERLAGGDHGAATAADADARTARIAALAGPTTAPTTGHDPASAVAAASAGRVAGRAGSSNTLDLARALLASQDRGRQGSARRSAVRASRATIPLQEALYRLARQRSEVQADLQSTLGDIGPGWAGILGQVMQGSSIAPLALA